MKLSARYPGYILALIMIISMAAIYQLDRLQIDVSPKSLTLDDREILAANKLMQEDFGDEQVILVYVEDAQLISPAKIEMLRDLVARLNALDSVVRSDSLYSLPYLRVDNDNVITDAYLEPGINSLSQLQHRIAAAQQNPIARRNLLSQDGTAMAIYLYPRSKLTTSEEGNLTAQIEQILTPFKNRFDSVFQLGTLALREELTSSIVADLRQLIPLSVLVLALSLLFTMNLKRYAMLPLVTAGLSVLWTLGGLALLGIPLSLMSAMVPVLLIIIGSTEDIHLVAEFHLGRKKGFKPLRSVLYMAKRMGVAVTLTFITSYLGFLSITASPVHIMRDFGLVASTGLLINFLLTVLLVPICLRYYGTIVEAPPARPDSSTRALLLERIVRTLIRQRTRVLWMSVSLLVAALIAATQLRVNNNLMDYFAEDAPVVQHMAKLNRQLAGLESFSIIFDSGIEGTFQKLRYLDEIREIQQYLEQSPAFDASFSFADHMALANSTVNDTGVIEMPEDDAVLEAIASMVDFRDISSFIAEDFSKSRILVRHHLASSQELIGELEKLRGFIAANTDRGLRVTLVGESITGAFTANNLVSGQAQSLVMMLVVIVIVIALLFRNLKLGLVAALPNLFPIALLFGVMGSLGIELNTSTAMITAIALGICIDHSMHFMLRYTHRLADSGQQVDGILQTVREEIRPISAATLALTLGIGVLCFSAFNPVATFGALCAMVILLAYLANFVITPVLLSWVRPPSRWSLLSPRVLQRLQRDCVVLRGLSNKEILQLFHTGRELLFERDSALGSAGNHRGRLYIVLRGRLEVARRISAADGLGRKRGYGPGQVYWMRPTDREGSGSNVIALKNSWILEISPDSIRSRAKLFPGFGFKLLHNLSELVENRLKDMTAGRGSEGNGNGGHSAGSGTTGQSLNSPQGNAATKSGQHDYLFSSRNQHGVVPLAVD